ncbi:MAG TPA: N-acyl homoserine lactonase family protein [Steroidobacteraceae bacterium]|nr:N-acyl homoserine lactonase family protein [Steroidobacteraceae bacterium]
MIHHIVLAAVLSLTLASPVVAASPAVPSSPAHGAGQAQQIPKYHVYAIRYGTLKDIPVNALVPGADPARKMDTALMMWLIRGNGRTILVDTGFYRDRFMKSWKPIAYIKPTAAIAKLTLKPEQITDIIITHLHWDHADGIDLFPKARVWTQKHEYDYYVGAAWPAAYDSFRKSCENGRAAKTQSDAPCDAVNPATDGVEGVYAEDILPLVRLNTEGRLHLIRGDGEEILPGITAYIGGKHTYESQYLGVNTAVGTVVLASDNVYLYENVEKHVPITETSDPASNLRAQERMKSLVSDPKYIIPGHDPAVFTKFKTELAPGIASIE